MLKKLAIFWIELIPSGLMGDLKKFLGGERAWLTIWMVSSAQ